MRAVKTSLEQLIKRIDVECGIEKEREATKRLTELRKSHAKQILELRVAKDRAEKLEEELRELGLDFWNDEDGDLSQPEKAKLEEKYNAVKKRFRVMRENVLIRLGLADDEERKFMVRHVFDEAASAFPALKSVVSKLTK